MTLAREDATRIIRFCLAGTGWGSALHEDDLCVLKIGRSSPTGTEVQRFEGGSFEEALRCAARAGLLKPTCLEKQIAFLARTLPDRNGERGEAVPDRPRRDGVTPPVEAMFSTLMGAVSALVHETQLERGASSLYLSSGGQLFSRELRAQWRTTDRRRAELMAIRQRQSSRLATSHARHLERAEDLLGELCAGRDLIESLQCTPAQAIERYSTVNGDLLSIVDELGKHGADTGIRPTALAWMALVHAKEKTGIERAQLANAFAWNRYVDGQHATVSALIASSDSYLHLFSAAAPSPADELLREVLRSDAASAVTEMEHIALSKRDGDFGIDPITWFGHITRKMDLLGDVESAVRASFSRGALF